MSWINELKVAVINSDANAVERLLEGFNADEFKNLEQLEEAMALNLQALAIFKSKQEALREQMDKLQSVKKYVQS